VEPAFRGVALALGTAWHRTIGHRLVTHAEGRTSSNGELYDFLRGALDHELHNGVSVLFDDDEPEATLVDRAMRMLDVFVEKVPPPEQVLGVEIPFSVELYEKCSTRPSSGPSTPSWSRAVMIIDYPSAKQLAPLIRLLRRSFDVHAEGCFGPHQGRLGRLYLAPPKRVAAKEVFAAAAEKFGGLVPIHPAIRTTKAAASGTRPAKAKAEAARRPATGAAAAPTLFDAIRVNDVAALARVRRADLDLRDERGRSPLFLAVLAGRTAFVERLVALGAELNPKRFAPLYAAVLRDRPREARLLIAAGAKPELARDADGDPALVAAALRESAATLRVLLSIPHSAEAKSLALLEAAGVGNLAIVKLLVKHGADPAWKSPRGHTALSIARKRKKTAIVAYFRALA
jgi:hypothetical protein